MIKKPIQGYIKIKKPDPLPSIGDSVGSVVQLVGDLTKIKADVVEIVDRKIKNMDDVLERAETTIDQKIQEVEQTILDAEKTIKDTAEEALQIIKDTKQGEPGKDADPKTIVQEVLSLIPKFDEEAFSASLLKKVPQINEDTLLKKFLKKIPSKNGDLKIIQENVVADPLAIIQQILALPDGEFKLKTSHIDGLDQTIKAFRSQIGKAGYLHGGGFSNIYNGGTIVTTGLTGLNFTGTGVTSVVKNASTGIVTVTLSGGGGGSAASPHYAVQYNDPLGTFAGNSDFLFNPSYDPYSTGFTGPAIYGNLTYVSGTVPSDSGGIGIGYSLLGSGDIYLANSNYPTDPSSTYIGASGGLSMAFSNAQMFTSAFNAIYYDIGDVNPLVNANANSYGFNTSFAGNTVNGGINHTTDTAQTYFFRARGTNILDSSTYLGLQSGDKLGNFSWTGWNTAEGYEIGLASLRVTALENFTLAGQGGVEMGLYVTGLGQATGLTPNALKVMGLREDGVYVPAHGHAGVTNVYGINISPQVAGTNNWNIWSGTNFAGTYDPYSALATSPNVFSLSGDVSAGKSATLFVITQTGSTGNGGNSQALSYVAQSQGTGKFNIVKGVSASIYIHGSGNTTTAVGNNAYIENLVGGSTLTSAIGFQANGAFVGDGGTITTSRGMRILNGTATSGGTLVNQIGLDIVSLTTGTTLNRAIQTGASGDVLFGYLASAATSLVTASSTGLLAGVTALPNGITATTQTQADNSTKVATTAYVDEAVIGQRMKEAVKYGSVAVLPSIIYANGSSGVGRTLTGVALAAISLDGASPGVGDRVLIKNQAAPEQNGIYVVTQTGSGIAVFILTGATDFDQASEIQTGDMMFVTAGNTLANTSWAYTGIDSPTMGTTALTFAQVSADLIVGQSVILSGTSTRILYDNAGVVGEYTLTGTGTVVAMQTAPTFLTSITTPQTFSADNAVTASSNAITLTRAFRNNVVTNDSAANATITLSTTSATAGDEMLVQFLDFSAVAKTITWVNTENSTVNAPVISNGSTTLPLTVKFKWNAQTSKWRCLGWA